MIKRALSAAATLPKTRSFPRRAAAMNEYAMIKILRGYAKDKAAV
jgi:hypothetical protein